AVLVEHDILCSHAVDIAAEGSALFRGIGRTLDPVLHEGARDTLADFPPSDIFANSHDFARAIGAWNARKSQPWVVLAEGDEQVAVIQGDGMNFDHDLSPR